MKRAALIILCSIPLVLHAQSGTASSTHGGFPATLQWKNGESISGDLLEASADAITWKTPLFDEPLVLAWNALKSIEGARQSVAPGDPFEFVMRDGSCIYGNLVSVKEKSVFIHSSRHGDVELKRSELLSARRIGGSKQLLFSGPAGEAGWRQVAVDRNIPHRMGEQNAAPVTPVKTQPGGALLLPYWNRGAYIDIDFPDLVDLEIRVRSSMRPDFSMLMEAGHNQDLRVETWDNDLVLAEGDQFKLIRKIGDDEHEIALRLCWDRKQNKCSVFTPTGEMLTEWAVPAESSTAKNRLSLFNGGLDLSVEFLRMRPWNGKVPPVIDEKQPRLELADGRILQGEAGQGPDGSIEWRTRKEEPWSSFPVDEVMALNFPGDPSDQSDAAKGDVRKAEAAFTYADGTVLLGHITSIQSGSATVEAAFAGQPVSSILKGLRKLQLEIPDLSGTDAAPALAGKDTVVIDKTTLHGTLTTSGDGVPHWILVGGSKPVTPVRNFATQITHAFPAGAEIAEAPALFYLSSGDVLPGNLRSVDRNGVEIESGIAEITKLRPKELDAIQFGAAGGMKIQGFEDPGWRVVKGDDKSLTRKDGKIEMSQESAIFHPAAMLASEFKFSYINTGFSVVRLRLFCAGEDGAKSSNLILGCTGNEFIAGMESSEGQLDSEVRAGIEQGKPVEVRLVIDEKRVGLYVDGVPSRDFLIDSAKRMGSGLIIEPGSLWGNNVNSVSLSDFSAVFAPGGTVLPNIAQDAKMQALTVPRFRKDDPPRQVLVGVNGDILPGEVEAATASHFGFRSGLDDFSVPRDRVKAVIWLKQPRENAVAQEQQTGSAVLKMLNQKIDRRMWYNAGLQQLVDVLKQQAPDLKFRLPENQDSREFQFRFGGQTIGETLTSICTMFGLTYRIDKNGVVVIEPPGESSAELTQTAYWLKAGAFPDKPSAREILAEKGIAFPDGARAQWQPKAGLLVMTNTPENQSKLQGVIDAAFGGNLGSPTHWLVLANGARLGLIVDKFGPDFITGHHPVFGQCKIPTAQVVSIRNVPVDPTAAIKSVEDWQLVYAPEPVLPEAGGDSSPLLGKEAKTFKLAMLGGGNFDLGQEKGKVVVLDFWATWCGPCVKSLPELIEAMNGFSSDRVKFVGVNQGEPPEQVKRFLEARRWKLSVAMDASQNVSRDYGADAIPHTVVIGQDGKVAWVKSGYSPDGGTEVAGVVKHLLEEASNTAPKKNAP